MSWLVDMEHRNLTNGYQDGWKIDVSLASKQIRMVFAYKFKISSWKINHFDVNLERWCSHPGLTYIIIFSSPSWTFNGWTPKAPSELRLAGWRQEQRQALPNARFAEQIRDTSWSGRKAKPYKAQVGSHGQYASQERPWMRQKPGIQRLRGSIIELQSSLFSLPSFLLKRSEIRGSIEAFLRFQHMLGEADYVLKE